MTRAATADDPQACTIVLFPLFGFTEGRDQPTIYALALAQALLAHKMMMTDRYDPP